MPACSLSRRTGQNYWNGTGQNFRNPQAVEDQASDRAHRIGQQRPVTVYRLVSKGTLEERIVELHHDKRALAEGVLEGGEGAVLPSTEELISLIRGG